MGRASPASCFTSKRRSGRTSHLPFPWWFWFPGLLPYGGCVCMVNVAEVPAGCCVVMRISPDWASPARYAAWARMPQLLGSLFDRTRRTRPRGRARISEDAAPQIRPQCGTSAAQVRHKCGTSAAQVRHKYGTSAAQVRHKCGTSAAQVRHKCGTSAEQVGASAEQVRSKCGASVEQVRSTVRIACGTPADVRRGVFWQKHPPKTQKNTPKSKNTKKHEKKHPIFFSPSGLFAGTRADPLRNGGGTGAAPVRNRCGTGADRVRNGFGTGSERVRNAGGSAARRPLPNPWLPGTRHGKSTLAVPQRRPCIHVFSSFFFFFFLKCSGCERMSAVSHGGAGPPKGFTQGASFLRPWLFSTAEACSGGPSCE